jgi:hypothetical protein
MAEMDIYMRRRLVALGGLVLFFILFVLMVKSCGGDEETPTPAVETGGTGATGTAGALAVDDYIQQADAICEPANLEVSELDPADTNATRQEFVITRTELKQLQSLQLAEPNNKITNFLADLSDVVDALKEKADALDAGDTATADTAQLAIDEAEVAAREAGEEAGFEACGQFLDAGEEPGTRSGGATTGGGVGTDTGTGTVPTDPGTVTPPTDTTAPPTDTGTVPPADTGGDTGGGIGAG